MQHDSIALLCPYLFNEAHTRALSFWNLSKNCLQNLIYIWSEPAFNCSQLYSSFLTYSVSEYHRIYLLLFLMETSSHFLSDCSGFTQNKKVSVDRTSIYSIWKLHLVPFFRIFCIENRLQRPKKYHIRDPWASYILKRAAEHMYFPN